MIYFLLLMTGAVIGLFAAFPRRFLELCSAMQNFCLVTLVFAMGVSLGRREELFSEFLSLGAAGVFFAVATLGGSVAAVFVLKYFLSRKGGG